MHLTRWVESDVLYWSHRWVWRGNEKRIEKREQCKWTSREHAAETAEQLEQKDDVMVHF